GDFGGTDGSMPNPGTLGTTASVPRLMPGQGVIVATGSMDYPAEFLGMSPEALAQLAVSKVVTFTSTYDHRIIQGAESGAFLARIEELLMGGRGFYEEAFADLGIFHKPFRWAVDVNPAFSADGRPREIPHQPPLLEPIHPHGGRGPRIAHIAPQSRRALQAHRELALETSGLTIWPLARSFGRGGLGGGAHRPRGKIIGVMPRFSGGKRGPEYRHISSP